MEREVFVGKLGGGARGRNEGGGDGGLKCWEVAELVHGVRHFVWIIESVLMCVLESDSIEDAAASQNVKVWYNFTALTS